MCLIMFLKDLIEGMYLVKHFIEKNWVLLVEMRRNENKSER